MSGSGSQSNFVTSDLCSNLNLSHIPASGVNEAINNITSKTNATVKSMYNAFSKNLDFLVINKITDNLPAIPFNSTNVKIPGGITLADPSFNEPGQINVLSGAGVFWDLICVGQIRLNQPNPIMQKTHLGWILSGSISQQLPPSFPNICNFSRQSDIQTQLEKFWSTENDFLPKKLKEQECENLFVRTTTRDLDARFVVHLPIKENVSLKSLCQPTTMVLEHVTYDLIHHIQTALKEMCNTRSCVCTINCL